MDNYYYVDERRPYDDYYRDYYSHPDRVTHDYFYERRYPGDRPSRYWHLLEQAESKDSAKHDEHDRDDDAKEHSHYMHGSEDVTHHTARYAMGDTDENDREDLGRYMHGSEDISHHRRWYYMLQALEQEE